MTDTGYDTIVVGGGPAGSTAGALLAQYGHRVLIVDRESSPRYHVGESLIPHTWFTLNRLGVVDWLRESGSPKKYSVQFVSLTGQVSKPFYFFETITHECSQTWQVVRSDFDAMLLDNAREKGAEVLTDVIVRDPIVEHDRVVGVKADLADGTKGHAWRARCVIDATGRDSLFARKFGWKHREPDLNKVSLWTYFRGARRDEGLDEGATTIAYLPQKGWFWYIPLKDDIVSVGVVAEPDYLYRDTREPDDIFAREVAGCSWIRDHLNAGQQLEPIRVTGDYSYHSTRIGGDGFCLAGDAFAFLDPLFSTGVFLALKGGEMAADAVHEGLVAGEVTARCFDEYYRRQEHAVRSFGQLVRAFYDPRFSFRDFLDVYPQLQPLIVDTLVGNVFTDLQPLFQALDEFRANDTRAAVDASSA